MHTTSFYSARVRRARLLWLALLCGACNDDHPDPLRLPDGGLRADDAGQADATALDRGTYEDIGTSVTLALRAEDSDTLRTLEAQIEGATEGLTRSTLLAERAVHFDDTLGYDPRSAAGLSQIQASPLRLNDAELAKLSAQGFAISPRTAFRNMAEGLVSIYAADLPVYISLDAILDAVHVSYDAILKDVEVTQLSGALRTMLTDARSRLKNADFSPAVASDLDVYFTVALSLLEERASAPLRDQNKKIVDSLVAGAQAAETIVRVPLFGVQRDFDFSQFKPRGHYTDSEELKRYFRAMIWLGRTDFRLIETLDDGSSVFRRRQFEAVIALESLIQGAGRSAYDKIDAVVSAFVGEHDYMALPEIEPLLQKLGADFAALDDQTLAQKIIDSGYGAQRIASQVMIRPRGSAPSYPLGRSFALLGQRFVVDSYVFSNVVWDRVPELEGRRRNLPKGLDVAYAALGNAGALPMLADDLDRYGYAPQLEMTRLTVDAHGDDYWNENLYNVWLSALRALSPGTGAQAPGAAGRPALTGSEAWNRRLLNTQLGSWAELRHDTILYAKQSYTSGVSCEFPDGYVDPYPEAFARLEVFANKGLALTDLLGAAVGDRARLYFAELAQVSAILRTMAAQEATGVPFDAAQLSFLNDAVRRQLVACGAPVGYEGWYSRLLYTKSSEDMDPTIADVHTDPGDNAPPKVLYAATGLPRLMVVTRESCSGPRAYAGIVFAYHEFAQELPRIDDIVWSKQVMNAEDVDFMKPILP